ncbi:hypothetical protein [Streptomyces fuscichromogenes]|uniref:hypothetical protein n=1 Tax=Streptomyces fuscichromogenes TaxID=1324013 RepID=UPI00166F743D|nr:hypothetical protein [Streptomyces fuscichromogenes]
MTHGRCSRRGGPLRTTACSSTSSPGFAAVSEKAPGHRPAGGTDAVRPLSRTGRGSIRATAVTAAPATVPSTASAAAVRASARHSSQATTSAATTWAVVIAAPA